MHLKTLIRLLFISLITIGLIITVANTAVYCADIATVIKLNTVLRENPSESGEKVLLLKKKATLALIDREDTDGWLNVIHIKSGKEGWVKSKHVSLVLSNQPSPQPIFNEQKIEDNANPEIELENASYKDLILKVGDNSFEIPKHTTKTVSIVQGDYKYHASAPGVFPAIGKKYFQTGYRYTWKFWIETKTRISRREHR